MKDRLFEKVRETVKRWIEILTCDSHGYFAEICQTQQKRIERMEAKLDRHHE